MAIASFGCKKTESFYHDEGGRYGWQNVAKIADRKLEMLNAANDICDLQVPPGNRLERLMGDLQGFYSIRINKQWRIIFRWEKGDAHDVEIVDYH